VRTEIEASSAALSPIKGAKTPEATRPGTLLLASTVLWPLLAAACCCCYDGDATRPPVAAAGCRGTQRETGGVEAS